jgi:DNA mismatch repair ATPase MutS
VRNVLTGLAVPRPSIGIRPKVAKISTISKYRSRPRCRATGPSRAVPGYVSRGYKEFSILTWQKIARYLTPETMPRIRALQEARERLHVAKRAFFGTLLQEFDKDRSEWLKAIRVIAELDCLVSLAKASAGLDSPKCRPVFVDAAEAFIDFTELRHPSMCLRSSFIANDVQLGGETPRQVLLTGPNMAGKSTLLRMTAAGVIMAQLGCYVPAESARLSPIDRIQTRMGAYDSGFHGLMGRDCADCQICSRMLVHSRLS